MILTLEIPGPVQAWERPRPRMQGYGYITPKKTTKYKEYAAVFAKKTMAGKEPLKGYISLDIQILEEIPFSFSKLKTSRCLAGDFFPTKFDIDNAAKSILDSCNKIIWQDDRQIVHLNVLKSYGPVAKAIIRIHEISNILEIM